MLISITYQYSNLFASILPGGKLYTDNLISVNNLNSGMSLPLSDERKGAEILGSHEDGDFRTSTSSKRPRTTKTIISEDDIFKVNT